MAGTLSLKAAMSMPGTTLSQLGMNTSASKAWAMATSSMESAMISREGKEYFMPCMVHGNAVADADDRKLHGGAACHADPRLYGICDLAQMDMAGDDLIG